MKRRDFIAGLAAGAALPYVAAAADSGAEGRSAFLLSRNGCGRATGYAETNKIVTLDGKTHVAWLDSVKEGFRARVRTLDRQSGQWSPTYTLGEAFDNHGGPALTVDSKGYLHAVYYPHHHPFRYRRSARPNDASEWGEEARFGKRCTYPTLMCGPDDTLYLTCRESNNGKQPWVVNLYTKTPGGEWSRPTAILRADDPGYSHFQEALAWSPDGKTLHLSTRMYGGNPRRAHTVGYLRSPDFGKTWEDASGKRLELPATSNAISAIARHNTAPFREFRCGAIAIDPTGAPCVLFSDAAQRPSAAWIAVLERGGAWRRIPLLPQIAKAFPGWGLTLPGGLCFGAGGRLYVTLTAQPPGADGQPTAPAWGDPSQEVIWLESADGGATFAAKLLTKIDATTPHWLPNLERPTGQHQVTRPGLLYTAGEKGGKNTDRIANEVWWLG